MDSNPNPGTSVSEEIETNDVAEGSIQHNSQEEGKVNNEAPRTGPRMVPVAVTQDVRVSDAKVTNLSAKSPAFVPKSVGVNASPLLLSQASPADASGDNATVDAKFDLDANTDADATAVEGSEGLDAKKARVALSKYILKQIEFQFSNTNLWKDYAFQKEMAKNPDQWIPLATVAHLPAVECKSADMELIISALGHSNKLVLDEENTKVRRKQPLPPYNANKDSKRTLYVGGLPVNSTCDSVRDTFSVFGQVLSVMPVCLGLGVPLAEIPFNSFQEGHEYMQVFICFEARGACKLAQNSVQVYNNPRWLAQLEKQAAATPKLKASSPHTSSGVLDILQESDAVPPMVLEEAAQPQDTPQTEQTEKQTDNIEQKESKETQKTQKTQDADTAEGAADEEKKKTADEEKKKKRKKKAKEDKDNDEPDVLYIPVGAEFSGLTVMLKSTYLKKLKNYRTKKLTKATPANWRDGASPKLGPGMSPGFFPSPSPLLQASPMTPGSSGSLESPVFSALPPTHYNNSSPAFRSLSGDVFSLDGSAEGKKKKKKRPSRNRNRSGSNSSPGLNSRPSPSLNGRERTSPSFGPRASPGGPRGSGSGQTMRSSPNAFRPRGSSGSSQPLANRSPIFRGLGSPSLGSRGSPMMGSRGSPMMGSSSPDYGRPKLQLTPRTRSVNQSRYSKGPADRNAVGFGGGRGRGRGSPVTGASSLPAAGRGRGAVMQE